jgi:hypothetical protein
MTDTQGVVVGAVIAASQATEAAWCDPYVAAGAAASLTTGLAGLRAVSSGVRADRRFRPEIIRGA